MKNKDVRPETLVGCAWKFGQIYEIRKTRSVKILNLLLVGLIMFVPQIVESQDLVVTANSTRAHTSVIEHRPDSWQAVAYYYRANLLYRDVSETLSREELAKVSNWIDLPVERLPIAEVQELLDKFELDQLLINLETATACSNIDWPWIHDSSERKFLLHAFHEFSGLRAIASIINLKSRLELSERDFDSSLKHIAMQLAIARHLIGHPDYFHSDEGIRMAENILKTIEEFIQQPDSLNLYWFLLESVNELPSYQLASSVVSRKEFFPDLFPLIRSWEQQSEVDGKLGDRFLEFARSIDEQRSKEPVVCTKLANELADASRKRLIGLDWSEELIQAMPDIQVVVLDYSAQVRSKTELLETLLKKGDDDNNNREISLVAKDLHHLETTLDSVITNGYVKNVMNEIPDFGRRHRHYLKVRRKMEMLSMIESVRFHTDVSGGKIPKVSAELDQLPLPLGSFESRELEYSVRDHSFRVTSSNLAPSFKQVGVEPLRYEIEFRIEQQREDKSKDKSTSSELDDESDQ